LPIFEKTNKMAVILPVKGIHPKFGNNCFLAENSTIVGEVEMGDYCSVWFNAVVLSNTIVKAGYVYAGKPAKKIKKVGQELGEVFEKTANNYIKYAEWFK
jgi:carbonic anhydrase/acetyltransferase-like protein (isoleucine patch superfamily)